MHSTKYGENTKLVGEKSWLFSHDWAEREKYSQWQQGIKAIWESREIQDVLSGNSAITVLFDDYVHDSRAWFRVEPPESWGFLRWRYIISKGRK
ncbi:MULTISPECIES: hypothetical protein [unclassified Neisseria]|uniref:hypothetical protein n=1 Tax=unclassified Neisseria TaxID=2623750 RepID=UPI002665AB1C|nr:MULTISPECIES: hypothetical protein [unclassified Neisseria]MDO1510111.1 hypothetical protein [Neisseria sp. MVDL19-042950]MDO1516687.1 hypothetical protein [Neisseria sp. MVDL18-041461]MDO1563834.1 hypothetical protein [Neisseria sp. MVDL20-010259]